MENTARPVAVDPTASQTDEGATHGALPGALPGAFMDEALADVKAEIAADAADAPAAYLRHSIVPEGGE